MRKILVVVTLILMTWIGSAQQLIYSTDQNKHCTIDITMSEIKNNQFDVSFRARWVDENVHPLVDPKSVVGFETEKIWCNSSKYVKLLPREKDLSIVSFNSDLILTFEINEEYQGGEIILKFPFFYAADIKSAETPALRQDFTFRRPRNYQLAFNVDKKSIVDRTPPKLEIIYPADVDKGLKPIVDSSSVKVVIFAKDFFGLEKIQINNISPSKIGDSLYVADVPLKVGYENPISITVKDNNGLTTQKEFKVEARKPSLMIAGSTTNLSTSINRPPSDVDIDIPVVSVHTSNRFALIIGNEDYSTYQKTLHSESDVEFAIHDAQIFKEYAVKVMGVSEENIIFLTNAKAIEMNRELNKISSIIKSLKGQAEVFVFYAGHGFPDEQTREPYLIPVDVSGSELQYAIRLNEFYKKLSEFPSKRVTVFLDACFSGGGRNDGLIAARGVKVKPKEGVLKGNLVVFAASSGEQSSLPYRDKQHGIFTYFLLKKIKESQGELTYKELSGYLNETVSVRSLMVNNKEQNPQTNISIELGDKWKEWKLK